MCKKKPSQIRQIVRQRRQALTTEQQQLAATQLVQQIQSHEKVISAKNIALFLSFDGELDTKPLIEWLWQQNKIVYIPVIHPFSPDYLLFIRYDTDTHLETNKFKIKEPKLDVRHVIATKELDIIFTPLVAFDKNGNRLGMGRGFYDRTLKNWHKSQTYPIGLAHDCQLVTDLVKQPWDIPLPEIITPTTHWRW